MDLVSTEPLVARIAVGAARRPLALRLPVAAAMLLLGATAALVAAEAVCRCLPVCSGLPQAVGGELRHWEPDTRYVFSGGWRLEHAVHGSTNAQGFVSPIDYTAASDPIVAFVGDSFVEGQMIDLDLAFPELATRAVGGCRAFRFAMPRSGLSEYVALAGHASHGYRPSAIVVTVVPGDVTDSLIGTMTVPGMHYFDLAADGAPLVQAPPSSSTRSWLLQRSALMRYIAMNLHLDPSPRAIVSRMRGRRGSGTTPVDDAVESRVVEAFAGQLRAAVDVPGDRVLIVVDADRSFAHGCAADAAWRRTRDRVMRASGTAGFRVLDLQPVLEQEWAAHHQPLDSFPVDNHWNARCHAAVAAAVASELRGMLQRSP